MKLFKMFRGKLRMLFGFCPYCNSSAPLLYNCPVCRYYHGYYPSKVTKQIWWENYIKELEKHTSNKTNGEICDQWNVGQPCDYEPEAGRCGEQPCIGDTCNMV